jgi:hypothetical protein
MSWASLLLRASNSVYWLGEELARKAGKIRRETLRGERRPLARFH